MYYIYYCKNISVKNNPIYGEPFVSKVQKNKQNQTYMEYSIHKHSAIYGVFHIENEVAIGPAGMVRVSSGQMRCQNAYACRLVVLQKT